MKKQIYIVGWNIGENSFGVTTPYLEYFNRFGQVNILTMRDGIVDNCDLLVLPGGKDLNPANYNQVPGYMNSNSDMAKEFFYRVNLPQYIKAKVPIFGICLGHQMLNTFFGGQLTQDIHNHDYSIQRSDLVHKLREVLDYDFENKKIMSLSTKSKDVNSLHHQGILIYKNQKGNTCNQLAPCMIPTHIVDDSSQYVVEAMIHESLPIASVQWHPEEIYDGLSMKMIHDLLDYNLINADETKTVTVE